MRRRYFSIYCVGLAVFVGLTASAWAYTYVVKKGDVLSEVVHELVPGRVWGKHGNLKKIIALNPHVKNPDLILPGEKIQIEAVENVASEKMDIPAPALIVRKPAEVEKAEVKVVPTLVPAEKPKEVAIDSSGAEKNTLFKRGALLALTPDYSLSVLSIEDRTTGTDSSIASSYNAGLHLSYMQEWTEATRTFVTLGLGMASFEKPTDSSKKIVDAKKFISGLGLGLSFDLSNRFNLETSANYQKELFARPTSTQSVTVDSVNVPSLGAKLSYDIVKLDPFVFGVSSSLFVKGPAKTDGYDVRLGAQYSAIIYLKQLTGESGSSNFQTELGFTARTQDTSITRQTERSLTLGVRFFFPVGRRDKGGH